MLTVEKLKLAFRLAYSIIDKVAYLITHYLDLPIADKDVYFRKIWYDKNNKKNGLQEIFQNNDNWTLHGLFWLSKDLFEEGFTQYLSPEAQQLSDVCNALEHKAIRVQEVECPDQYSGFSITRWDLEKKHYIC